jgi:CHAD domain-containing protein
MADATDASTFALVLTRKSLHRLVSQSDRAARSPSAAEVHDLRVAIRRFTQVLRVFRGRFPAKEVKRIRRALKKTMALAGEVRDLDVAIEFLAKSKLKEAAALLPDFKTRRNDAGRNLAGKLQSWAKRRIFSKWRRKLLLASSNPEAAELGSVEDVAKEILPRLVKRFLALGNHAADRTEDWEQLHQFRIAVKKLRYTLEIFAPPGSPLMGLLVRLKDLQAILGKIHDAELVREMVLQEGADDKLSAEPAKRRDHKVEEFRSHWTTNFENDRHLLPWRKDGAGLPRIRRKPPGVSESAMRLARDSSSAER